jgi:hypothetical protein
MRSMQLLLASAVLLGAGACHQPGPAEQLGKKVDKAVEDVRETGEKVGDRLDDAADDVRDGAEQARKDLER